MPELPYWSVYGYWARTGERCGDWYQAATARGAEDLAQMDALGKGEKLVICHVVAGQVESADRYTFYVDPQDPRNDGDPDIIPDVADLTAGDPEWTVLGIAVPAGWVSLDDPRVTAHGERYGDVVNATSPLAAEDVAGDRLKDKGAQLWVCAVLAGSVPVADTYATFADPDIPAART